MVDRTPVQTRLLMNYGARYPTAWMQGELPYTHPYDTPATGDELAMTEDYWRLRDGLTIEDDTDRRLA